MTQLLKNNVSGVLSLSLSEVATSMTLIDASAFPAPVGSEFYLATLIGLNANAQESTWEIVRVTAKVSNTLTIERAQEGTAAQAWGNGTTVQMRITAGTMATKVDKATGKDLSTNDYTTQDKEKLAGIAPGATNTAAPVNADWNAVSGLAEIKNKPAIPAGTVTSVALSVPTGFSVANSPVVNSGTLTITFSEGYALPTTANQSDWSAAFGWGDHSLAGYLKAHQAIKTLASQTLTGSGNVTLGDIGAAADGDVLKKASNLSDLADAGTARGNLGGTTVGQNLFTVANPSAIRFIRINAANTVTFRTAAQMLSDLGAFAVPSGTTAQYVRGDGSVAAFPVVPSEASKANIAAGSTSNFISPANLAALADDPQTISGGLSNTFDWSAGVNYTMSLTGNRTLSNPTNVLPGHTRVIIVQASTETQRTLSFGGNFKGDLPEVKVTNVVKMALFFYAISSTQILVSGVEI